MKDFDFWFAWSGTGTMRLAKRDIPVSAGTVFCLRPGQSADATHDPRHPLGVCYVHFDFLKFRRVVLPHASNLPPEHAVLPNVDLYERMLRHVVELFHQGTRDARDRAAGYLAAVLADVNQLRHAPVRAAPHDERSLRLAEVRRFVIENPGRIFLMDELAAMAGLSADHFARRFKNQYGVGPKAFCINTRMERARQLLGESAMSVTNVSNALGYADVYFFSRQFKQVFGHAPSELLKRSTTHSKDKAAPWPQAQTLRLNQGCSRDCAEPGT